MPTLNKVNVFFSYAHEDERLRNQLAKHLKILERQGVIAGWHDRKIGAGSEWDGEINDHLRKAQLILLLVSPDFIASDYCWEVEVQEAMKRHEENSAKVVPIIVRPVKWAKAPFGKLQALPQDAKPIKSWDDPDEAFLDVSEQIETLALELQKTLPPPPKSRSKRQQSAAVDSQTSLQPKVSTPTASALEQPEGQVPLDSPFYIERPPVETDCFETVIKPGSLIRVKAPRQMGKSSLMSRVLDYAHQSGCRTAYVNFQSADAEFLTDINLFLQWFCATVAEELELDDALEEYWKGVLGAKNKCTKYFQRYLLKVIESPLVLGLDEVDQAFQHPEIATDFFGLLRAWHERSKNEPLWQKLRLVIVHSKEVYIPLNINQSPFNVGLPIELPELSREQVEELIERHDLDWSEKQVEQLIGVVDGHPYLLRSALYHISRGTMSLAELVERAPHDDGPFGSHLHRHLVNLTDDQTLAEGMRTVIKADQPVRLDPTVAFKLRSLGLVQLEGNDVVPLCNLYRDYFRDQLGV